ncbi:HtaA domain-containing protein [Paramicrobacterium chengjingii]|uniref:HtaA domain-containing protein n=1 Tax=Paramicrobacterium chengjingii TaxID=2769067 RepID=UPI00141E4C27|nr:HtaA domain-containing protein [Microbacterium chengjingii]
MDSQLTRQLRRGAALLTASALTAAGLVLGGAVFAPTDSAQAAESPTVSNASLTWGVKASFRNYIYNFAMFEGKSTLLGTTTQDGDEGVYTWSGGSGTATSDGSTADVDFGDGNGVHFQSHPMDGGYALDMQFVDPHVVVTSATTAELRLDVTGREFIDTTTVGPEYTLTDVVMADLDLASATKSESQGKVTWTGAPATLTTDGSKAFGGFYEAGVALDPVSLTLPITEATPAPVERTTDAGVTSATSESGLTVSVTGAGYTDLPAPTSGYPAGIYVALRDANTVSNDDLNANQDAAAAVEFVPFAAQARAVQDGTFAQELTAAVDKLDSAASYEVVVWAAHGNITDETLIDTVPVSLTQEQRSALFPDEDAGDDSGDDQPGNDSDSNDGEATTPGKNSGSTTPKTPAQAESKPKITCTVQEVKGTAGTPQLSWGVKSSFVSYIEGGIANGSVSASNGASRTGSGFLWGSGSGSISDAGQGTVSFPGSVHFTGHDGVLNTTISGLRVKATGSNSGTLVADVASKDMDGNNVGGSGVSFATLSFSSLSASGGTASVALTTAGAKAFAGFYNGGQAMDSLTVSFSGARQAGTEQVCYDENGNRVNPDGTPYTGGPAVNTGGVVATGVQSPADGWAVIALGFVFALLAARRVMRVRR